MVIETLKLLTLGTILQPMKVAKGLDIIDHSVRKESMVITRSSVLNV